MAGGPPRKRVEREMSPHLRAKSSKQRVEAALRQIEENGWTGAAAARWAGVAPETVSRARSRARQAKATALGVALPVRTPKATLFVPPQGLGERRRVEPISEFVRKYFTPNQRCFSCRGPDGRGLQHEVPPFHDEMMRLVTESDYNRIIGNVPPEHSKTTNVTVFTSIHGICEDPNIQMAFMSAGDDLANDMVRQVMNLLTDEDLYAAGGHSLIQDYGPFNDGSTTWTQKAMVVCGRKSMERDPTLRSFGIMSKIYGRRLNRAYLDDVADPDNNDTPQKVAKMLRKITGVIDSRVGDAGKLIVVGTRVSAGDVYKSLAELPDYYVYRRPMILDYERELTLWPEHIGWAKAMSRKGRTTPADFELIYQNSDSMGDGSTWTEAHLQAARDLSRSLGDCPPAVSCFIGLDPAGDGPQAGYSAMVLVAVDRRTGMRSLVDLVNVRAMKSSQMKAQVVDWCQRFPVFSFAFEDKGVQAQIFAHDEDFRRTLTEAGTRLRRGPRTHDRSGYGGKRDPVWGIEAMATAWHNGFWSTPWADARTRRAVGELEEQLLRFPMEGAPTDLLMALWIAEGDILTFLKRSRRQMFADREREDAVPDEALQRRRVHSRGGVREARPSDFGLGRREPPSRVVNVGPELERELLDEMS